MNSIFATLKENDGDTLCCFRLGHATKRVVYQWVKAILNQLRCLGFVTDTWVVLIRVQ